MKPAPITREELAAFLSAKADAKPAAPQSAEDAAYERGYRRGRTEATAEARKFYADRIHEAVAILQAPIPLKGA